MVRNTKNYSKRRSHKGGSQGFGYGPGASLLPAASQLGEQIHQRYDSCMTVDRPGQQSFSLMGGLPGMKGGAVYGKAASGGRYSVDVASPLVPGLAEVTKTGCEPSLTQKGGVGLSGAADSQILSEGTARYTTAPSGWVGGTGAPVLLNQSLDQTAWSKTCTQTAGRRSMRKQKRTMKKRTMKKSKKSRSRC
jgi:hypothetical protein